ncbi:MAG: hypothetical protein AB1420_05315 [Bacillota bacterium]
MYKFDDKVTLGVFAGIISNTVKNILENIACWIDHTIHPLWHLATTFVLPLENHDKIPNIIIGIYADYTIASILGIIIVFFIYYTSTKQYVLKGLIIGSAAWLLIYIPATQFNISKIDPNTVSANIVYILSHLLLGIIAAWVIARYGKDALSR